MSLFQIFSPTFANPVDTDNFPLNTLKVVNTDLPAVHRDAIPTHHTLLTPTLMGPHSSFPKEATEEAIAVASEESPSKAEGAPRRFQKCTMGHGESGASFALRGYGSTGRHRRHGC